jgi:hypothetical protein
MLTLHPLAEGTLLLGIFSGVTRDAELLDAYESFAEQGNIQPQDDELYFFATGAKLLISYSTYKLLARPPKASATHRDTCAPRSSDAKKR